MLLTVCLCWTLSPASVQINVCNPDTLEIRPEIDIMVGSKVAIVISSDLSARWSGGLFIEGTDRSLGMLSGRAGDPNSPPWASSCLPAAGEGAEAVLWKDSLRWGFDFYTDDLYRQAGKWFVVDYEATQPGHCSVAYYDHEKSWLTPDPNESIVFFNTQTRDLKPDGIVNFADFSVFASNWDISSGPGDPNDPNLLNPADFNVDGSVNLEDVCMFSEYWMYGVQGWQPKIKVPAAELPDPNITFSIHSPDMLSEITLAVGESITLYIDKVTDSEDIYIINLEAMISDPNLGCIDNRTIDPNDPNNSGTARLLFEPRVTSFDYWGPGKTQLQGIEFLGFNLSEPIQDGALASFIYTATAEGTVELQLADYVNYSHLESIIIHQQAPAVMTAQTSGDLMTLSAETTSAESSSPLIAEEIDPDELADFLDDVYNTDEELQQAIDEESWTEFVESVRNGNEPVN